MNIWTAYRVGMKTKTAGRGGVGAVLRQLAGNLHRPEKFSWMLRPIDFLRYREFDFALRLVARLPTPRRMLDLSSPKLLPLTLAHELPSTSIVSTDILQREVDWTRAKGDELHLSNLTVERADARCLLYPSDSFDLVTSLSVFEHIAPARGGDLPAIAEVFRVLRPGGSAIFTVPCSRTAFDEYQVGDVYERAAGAQPCFFQRVYDPATLQTNFVDQHQAELMSLRYIDEHHLNRDPRRRLTHWLNCSPLQNRLFGPLYPLLAHALLSPPRPLHKCRKPTIACLWLRKPSVPQARSTTLAA